MYLPRIETAILLKLTMTISNLNPLRIAIVNCGVGNIGSLENALKSPSHNVDIISSPENLNQFDRLVLPGVGSFGRFMGRLAESEFIPALRDFITYDAKKVIGICVGMQVLFDKGLENGEHYGLGFIPGEVRRISLESQNLRVPHVGWNNVNFSDEKLNEFTGNYYFTHSYVASTLPEFITGTVNYGSDITAAVVRGNVYGFQFHPEKSGKLGSKLLNFACDQ